MTGFNRWRTILGYRKEMRDESRGARSSTLAQRAIIFLGQNYHRCPTSPRNVLRLSLQSRVNDLAELSLCVL